MSRLHHPADLSDPINTSAPANAPCQGSSWLEEGPVRVDIVDGRVSIEVDEAWESLVASRDLGPLISRSVAIHQASLSIGLNPQDWPGEATPETDPHLGRELARLAREVSCADQASKTDVSTLTAAGGAVRLLTRNEVICCIEVDPAWAAGRGGAQITTLIAELMSQPR